MKMENNVAVPIEIFDSDDEDNRKQQVPPMNDAIPETSRGDVNFEHQQSDGVRAASPKPDLNRKSGRHDVEHETAIAAPIGSQRSSKNLSSNRRKQPKPDANGFYRCKVCKYSTQVKPNYNRHRMKHSANAVKPFKCEYCDYAAREKFNLEKHQRMHKQQHLMGIVQDPIDGMFKCTHCDEEFMKWHYLRMHLTKSHNQRLFNCVKCMRQFAQKIEKERHEFRCQSQKVCY